MFVQCYQSQCDISNNVIHQSVFLLGRGVDYIFVHVKKSQILREATIWSDICSKLKNPTNVINFGFTMTRDSL